MDEDRSVIYSGDLWFWIAKLLQPYRGQVISMGFEMGPDSRDDYDALIYTGVLLDDEMNLRSGFTLAREMDVLYCFNRHDSSSEVGTGGCCFASYESILGIFVPDGLIMRRVYWRHK
tara:strand:+ start:258 stop:608 length:351 start_codon:yes stop_codon:yes gene_type:complete